jgi:hypothetical protein
LRREAFERRWRSGGWRREEFNMWGGRRRRGGRLLETVRREGAVRSRRKRRRRCLGVGGRGWAGGEPAMVAETVVLLPGNKAQSSATQRARMCSSV